MNRYFTGTEDYEFNHKITNLINQLRVDNMSNQALRIVLIDEKNWMMDEFTSIFAEDPCREEPHYADYLCNIHSDMVAKYEELEGFD